MTTDTLALLISELIDDDVRVLSLPRGAAGISDVVVETLDGKKVFLISVVDFTQVLAEAKDR